MGGTAAESIGALFAEILTSWWVSRQKDEPKNIPIPQVCAPFSSDEFRMEVAMEDGRTLKLEFLRGTFSYRMGP